MSNRVKRVFSLILLVLVIGLYWGCTQPPDLLVPVSTSEVSLSPQLFPSNFPGMLYELWVANGTDTASLGRFGFDNILKNFLDTTGALRAEGNKFTLEDNIYKYSKIFVSVETNNDPSPNSPGPIMLIDDVTVPKNSAIDLVFPNNEELWEATCRYNMETTSDSNRFALDGYGIWFANYQRLNDSVRDTLSLDSFWVDSSKVQVLRDTIIVNLVDTANVVQTDTTRVFGVDSYQHDVVRFTRILQYDTVQAGDSALVTVPNFKYTIGSLTTFDYDEFTQDSFALPDYSAYGWVYKGWVVSPYVNASNVGNLTPPAWPTYYLGDSVIKGMGGGLLTTGEFTSITGPDSDGNPYKNPASNRVPKFPGEDFITFPSGWSGLTPFASGNSGTVFITLEPINFISDTTNFPLLAFIGKIPSNFSTVSANEVIINMFNRTQVTDPRIGFPRIRVDIKTN